MKNFIGAYLETALISTRAESQGMGRGTDKWVAQLFVFFKS